MSSLKLLSLFRLRSFEAAHSIFYLLAKPGKGRQKPYGFLRIVDYAYRMVPSERFKKYTTQPNYAMSGEHDVVIDI